MEKITINGEFSIVMLNYQRVSNMSQSIWSGLNMGAQLPRCFRVQWCCTVSCPPAGPRSKRVDLQCRENVDWGLYCMSIFKTAKIYLFVFEGFIECENMFFKTESYLILNMLINMFDYVRWRNYWILFQNRWRTIQVVALCSLHMDTRHTHTNTYKYNNIYIHLSVYLSIYLSIDLI